MARWKGIATMAAAALALAACSSVDDSPGGETEAPEGGGETTAEAGPFTIGISNAFVGSEYRTQMIEVIEEVAAEYQAEGLLNDLVIENADTDVNGQIQQVRNLINAGVDAIIIDPESGSALDAVFQEAIGQGILVFAIDQAVDSEEVINVGIDQGEWAATSANWLADELGEGADIVVVNGISGNPANEARWGAAEAVFDEKGINVLTVVDGGWDQTTGQQQMSTLLSTYPNIDGVWTQDGMAQGILQALISEGKQNDILISGEARNGFMRLWSEQDEGFSTIGVINPPGTGGSAIHFAVAMLQGATISEDALTDGHNVTVPLADPITNENFDEIWETVQDNPDTYVLDSVMTRDEVAAMLVQ